MEQLIGRLSMQAAGLLLYLEAGSTAYIRASTKRWQMKSWKKAERWSQSIR